MEDGKGLLRQGYKVELPLASGLFRCLYFDALHRDIPFSLVKVDF